MTIVYIVPARDDEEARECHFWCGRDRVSFHKRRLRANGFRIVRVTSD